MTMPTGAVLFDMDGVLVDSEPIWYEVEGKLVARLGGTWGREHQVRCIGGTVDATCRYIVELTGTTWSVAQVQSAVMADMVAALSTGLAVHEGALDLVDAVRSRGVPTGLVTSSFRVIADAALAVLGRRRFDVVVTGDEVTRGKPDPEPYARACDLLGVPPAKAVVIEDALTGVRSAEAAGCLVVAVPSVAPIEASGRRVVVDRIADIDPDWLLGLLGGGDGLQDVELGRAAGRP